MSPLLLVTLCVSALYGWVAWRLQRTPPFKTGVCGVAAGLAAHGALIYQSVLDRAISGWDSGNSLSTILWLTALT